ncbi:MAG: nuclear transport factor 2 family protein [Candidatus Latescibacterota bacterium]|jgi:ketosteroid isomerase-like protein
MTPDNPTPTEIALEFLDAINRGDLGALLHLMSPNHRFEVFDDRLVIGREANASAWRTYLTEHPRYTVHPQRTVASGNVVAILGSTTGSHLGLPDAEESRLTLIWIIHIQGSSVEQFRLLEDLPSTRARYGL